MADQSLPGMENREIEELNELARDYVKKRDRRQKILLEEVELKGSILRAMKKRKKETYDYEDVHIEIVIEEETVKVRVRKAKDDTEE